VHTYAKHSVSVFFNIFLLLFSLFLPVHRIIRREIDKSSEERGINTEKVRGNITHTENRHYHGTNGDFSPGKNLQSGGGSVTSWKTPQPSPRQSGADAGDRRAGQSSARHRTYRTATRQPVYKRRAPVRP
jgi:hypothetical protein